MPVPTGAEEDELGGFIQAEIDHIKQGREQRLGQPEKGVPWSGIGLSGGGIRSACLALGVLQVLAERGLLSRFDYISTVSGGGYIGSSLQWWWARKNREDEVGQQDQPQFGAQPENFPYGPSERPTVAPPKDSSAECALKNLDFLRAHASYLTPGNELTIWSMLIVVLRTVAISLLIWLPLSVLVFVIWHYLDKTVFNGWAVSHELYPPLGGLIPANWGGKAKEACDDAIICNFYLRAGYAGLVYAFGFALALFGFVAILYGFISRAPQDRRSSTFQVLTAAATAIAAVAGLFFMTTGMAARDVSLEIIVATVTLLASITLVWAVLEIATPKSLNPSYFLRRGVEKWLGKIFIPSMTFLAIGLIPVVSYYVGKAASADTAAKAAGGAAGLVSLVSGIASALYSYYVFVRNIVPGLAARIAATAGSLLSLYGLLILAYWLSIVIVDIPSLISESTYTVQAVSGCLAALAFLLALYGNINYVGLHRYYRDRLMEAFMPTDASVRKMRIGRSPVADDLSMVDLRSASQTDPNNPAALPAPYPLINTNVILVKDDNPEYATRGGANFLISPLCVGSSATGWHDTKEYIRRYGPMTLPTAMAASGAAASASAGSLGTGITMNPIVAAVMSLLNIRLGLWVGNPALINERTAREIPTFLNPGFWAGVLGMGHRSDNRFIELTDGGHFENLAMYELVRRKLDLILVVDGEADPKISLSSLVSARNRIEKDFGARLDFFDKLGPELLVMHAEEGYPVDAKFAQSPFIVGQLTYRSGKHGTFIYIKSNITPALDFSVAGYLASNPDFPHQSTVDQFFSPDQFEAYRNLGAHSARKMIDKLDLCTTAANPPEIIDRYKKTGPGILPLET